MKCPYCGAEMKEGWIQSGRPFFWGEEQHESWFTPDREKDEFYVSKGFWLGAYAEACYCDPCKKVILSVEEPEEKKVGFLKKHLKK